jgi:hypothetical protein
VKVRDFAAGLLRMVGTWLAEIGAHLLQRAQPVAARRHVQIATMDSPQEDGVALAPELLYGDDHVAAPAPPASTDVIGSNVDADRDARDREPAKRETSARRERTHRTAETGAESNERHAMEESGATANAERPNAERADANMARPEAARGRQFVRVAKPDIDTYAGAIEDLDRPSQVRVAAGRSEMAKGVLEADGGKSHEETPPDSMPDWAGGDTDLSMTPSAHRAPAWLEPTERSKRADKSAPARPAAALAESPAYMEPTTSFRRDLAPQHMPHRSPRTPEAPRTGDAPWPAIFERLPSPRMKTALPERVASSSPRAAAEAGAELAHPWPELPRGAGLALDVESWDAALESLRVRRLEREQRALAWNE